MKRISNGQARQYVQNRKEFRTHTASMYGYTKKSGNVELYIVCSYGGHHPLFIYEAMLGCPVEGVWYENVDKCSKTTSGHRTQAHPHTACTPMTSHQMWYLAEGGMTRLMEATAKY